MLPDPIQSLEVTVEQTVANQQSTTPALLIDCREAEEYAHCRIAGARLVPLSSFMGAAEAEFPNQDTPAIIYCHHGVRSLRAAHYLREQGYTHCFSMRGGIDAWSLEVDSTVARY